MKQVSYFFVILVVIMMAGNILGQDCPTGNFGVEIDNFQGVPARSNGDYNCWTWTGNGTWQCVEYVKRFYRDEVNDPIDNSWGTASQAYDISDPGLNRYPQGGTTVPEIGDILCFDGEGTSGHVGIITEVGADYVKMIDQNRTNSSSDIIIPLSLEKTNGNYSIGTFDSDYYVEGWLRDPDYDPSLTYTAFLDDFEDGDAIGWSSRGLGTWLIENGSYVLECEGSQQWGKSMAGNPNWTDYTIDVDIRGTSGIDKQVWIREQHDCNTYAIMLQRDRWNYIQLIKYIDCVEQFRKYFPTPFPVYNGQWYHLTVSVVGDHIQAYLDNELVVDFTDEGTSLTHGRIGLGGYIHSGGYKTEFDNVTVTGASDILPSIYITAPNDGGLLKGGAPAGINWTCMGPGVDHIRILYSSDNGATFNELAVVPNTGHYQWDVPDEAAQNAIIRVQAESVDNTVLAYDNSDKSFPIMPEYVAFVDDFEDGDAAGWITYGPGAWNVVNGEYHYDISNANRVSSGSVTGNMEWSDYVFEVDFKGIRGVDKGFHFRNSPSETYYVACLVPWSSYTYSEVVLVKYQDGGESWRVRVAYPFNNEQWYHLTIVAIGSRIQVFIDGDLVADKTDEVNPILTGRIGLSNFTSAWNVATTVYDNVKVTGPSDILPFIYLTSPNDGGFLRGGSPAGIDWQCVGPNVDHIRIQYSDDNGAIFSDLAVVPNTGHYDWDVPNVGVQNAVIKMQAEAADNSILAFDLSDRSFPILPYYVALVDDFEDGDAAGWITYGPGAWNVVNGEYHYDISNANRVSSGSVTGNMEWSDYVFEVDFKGIRGVDKGFHFRNSPSETYYVACLVPWSSYTYSHVVLAKVQDGGEPWRVRVAYPFNNEQWYHLTIVAIGSRIQVFIDGDLVADKTDEVNPILTGRIGLSNFTSGWDVATTAFDNVKVTGPSDILPFIYLTSPNDGGFLRGGSPAGINWQCLGPNVDHIRIQYSDNNGATFVDLAMVANSGHYDWDVPAIVVQDAVIRVQAESMDNIVLATDHSDKSFPILPTYIAFTDDFEDGNADGWETSGDGTWTSENGVYTFACSGFPKSGKSLTGNTDWADYVVETDIKGSLGINKYVWIREEHACNTYTAVLLSDPHNQVLLIKYIDCIEQFRIQHPLPFTVANGELYHMTVAAIKDRFQVFINDHLAIDFTDGGTEITHGRIGLGGYIHSGSYRTEFDNVLVWGDIGSLELLSVTEIQGPSNIIKSHNYTIPVSVRNDGTEDLVTVAFDIYLVDNTTAAEVLVGSSGQSMELATGQSITLSLITTPIPELANGRAYSWLVRTSTDELNSSSEVIYRDRTPVIIIPGILGTYIVDNGETGDFCDRRIWFDCFHRGSDFEFFDQLMFEESGLVPTTPTVNIGDWFTKWPLPNGRSIADRARVIDEGVLGDNGCFSPITIPDKYWKLAKELSDVSEHPSAHYVRDTTLYIFPYDWRYDNRVAVDSLEKLINSISDISDQVDIICHSMGSFVARGVASRYPGSKLRKLLYLGAPHYGSMDILIGAKWGMAQNYVCQILDAEFVRQFTENLVSSYELFPNDQYLQELPPLIGEETALRTQLENGGEIVTYSSIDEIYGLFADRGTQVNAARVFSSEISSPSGAAELVYNIVGYGKKTIHRADITLYPDIIIIIYTKYKNGDGRVAVFSARGDIPDNRTWYIKKKHVDIPKADAVIDFIGWQLLGWPIAELSRSVPEKFDDYLSIASASPIRFLLEDSLGRQLGYIDSVTFVDEIPDAVLDRFTNNEVLVIPDTGSFHLTIIGVDSGTSDVYMNLYEGDSIIHTSAILHFPTVVGMTAELSIVDGNVPNTISVDFDGDGISDSIAAITSGGNVVVSVLDTTGHVPLHGVQLDVYDSSGYCVTFAATDSSGNAHLKVSPNIPYSISVVSPIGLLFESPLVEIAPLEGIVVSVEYTGFRVATPSELRGRGYWMHQVNALLSSKGNPHETYESMCEYMELIRTHFNQHGLNPVNVFEVFLTDDCDQRLEALRATISPKKKATMNEKARAHLTALLLNMVSGKIAQWYPISEDSLNVSQAITYCNSLISDGNADNDELAKDIAEMINEGQVVPAGMIDPSTANITYKQNNADQLPTEFALSQNYPNPFNPTTEISFALPNASDVKLEVFNIMGQKVATLIDQTLEAGEHKVVWDGSQVASGTYFYRLDAGEFTKTRKMILLK